MGLAFRLFKKDVVTRQDVNELYSEIGEFLSEAGYGITDAVEFLIIKSFAWDEIFTKTDTLNKNSWPQYAEAYAALVAPFDVLNVVLGQDIRKMDEDLNTPRVFGQSLNKLAFGYSSDFTGTRVLVPEILLTACRFFEGVHLEDYPSMFFSTFFDKFVLIFYREKDLFDSRVALSMEATMRRQLNEGIPLKRILLNANKQINKIHFYAVGTLLKEFCDQLPRPIFGFQACGRLVETFNLNLPEDEQLKIFIGIFTEMETVRKTIIIIY